MKKPILSELEREVFALSVSQGVPKEARVLLHAAGAVISGQARLIDLLPALSDPTFSSFNIPTETGAECGRQMAELLQIDTAKCCSSCAFVVGGVPNQCPSTINDALGCVASGEVFYCHTTGLPCEGWKASQKKTTPHPRAVAG